MYLNVKNDFNTGHIDFKHFFFHYFDLKNHLFEKKRTLQKQESKGHQGNKLNYIQMDQIWQSRQYG